MLTEPFNGGSAEGGPPQSVDSRCLWESERISNELLAVSSGIVKPLIQEMAQRYLRALPVTESLIGQGHRLDVRISAHGISH